MDFVTGALGALFTLVLFSAGMFVGWKLRGHFYSQKVESPHAEELKRMEEEQEAFRTMQQYSVERAYGMVGDLAEEEGGESA